MAAMVNSPGSYEVQCVIQFLNVQGCSASQIRYELYKIYEPTIVSEGKVSQWVLQVE